MPEFKEQSKFAKLKLLEQGRSLQIFLERASELNKDIKEFENESYFDVKNARDSLTIGTSDLTEALDMITSELGKLELNSNKKGEM